MKYKFLFNKINSIQPITETAWLELEKLFLEYELTKNSFLVREGEIAKDCFMLLEGVVRVFFNNDGVEYNKTFFIEGTYPTPLSSLISKSPSELSFQTLTNSKLIKFSYSKFRNLFGKHRCLESFMLRILEEEWIKKERQSIRMVVNEAKENYKIFQNEFPNLEQKIPQYHIASYLGVSPIQLSRIRAKLTK